MRPVFVSSESARSAEAPGMAAETAPERAGMRPGAEASADVTEGLAVVPGCIRVWDELLPGE